MLEILWKGIAHMLRLLVRLYLYVRGIRFFRSLVIPTDAVWMRKEIRTVCGRQVDFNFYRQTYEDYIYRFGKCITKEFTGVLIEAKVGDDLPKILFKFNNLRLMFDDRHYAWTEQIHANDIVLNIFLDFIISEIEKEQSLAANQ